MTRTEPARQRFSLTCTMELKDGRRVSGRIESDSPIRDALVRYSGDLGLLPFRCRTANSLVLRALFRSFAADFQAQYREALVEKTQPLRSLRSSRRQ